MAEAVATRRHHTIGGQAMMSTEKPPRGLQTSHALCLVVAILVALAAATPGSAITRRPAPTRAIAITIDDLPASPDYDLATLESMTRRLLAILTARRVPTVGFVNEAKLERAGEADARTRVLAMWTNAGLELANHTHSHPSFNVTPLDAFKEEVIRGERVTRELMGAKKMRLRYFRHPFLHTGPTREIRADFEKFLAKRGYTVAPVTVDGSDWLFSVVYDDALARGDRRAARRIADEYVRHTERALAFSERFSRDLFGREIKQILLAHANRLNADTFDRVLDRMRRRGYRFVSLEAALADPAYRHADEYAGEHGVSWFQRWAVTEGREMRAAPEIAGFVKTRYEELQNPAR